VPHNLVMNVLHRMSSNKLDSNSMYSSRSYNLVASRCSNRLLEDWAEHSSNNNNSSHHHSVKNQGLEAWHKAFLAEQLREWEDTNNKLNNQYLGDKLKVECSEEVNKLNNLNLEEDKQDSAILDKNLRQQCLDRLHSQHLEMSREIAVELSHLVSHKHLNSAQVNLKRKCLDNNSSSLALVSRHSSNKIPYSVSNLWANSKLNLFLEHLPNNQVQGIFLEVSNHQEVPVYLEGQLEALLWEPLDKTLDNRKPHHLKQDYLEPSLALPEYLVNSKPQLLLEVCLEVGLNRHSLFLCLAREVP
jgi:hypothetical protein